MPIEGFKPELLNCLMCRMSVWTKDQPITSGIDRWLNALSCDGHHQLKGLPAFLWNVYFFVGVIICWSLSWLSGFFSSRLSVNVLDDERVSICHSWQVFCMRFFCVLWGSYSCLAPFFWVLRWILVVAFVCMFYVSVTAFGLQVGLVLFVCVGAHVFLHLQCCKSVMYDHAMKECTVNYVTFWTSSWVIVKMSELYNAYIVTN